jgi:hypothetical protein
MPDSRGRIRSTSPTPQVTQCDRCGFRTRCTRAPRFTKHLNKCEAGPNHPYHLLLRGIISKERFAYLEKHNLVPKTDSRRWRV